MTYKCPVCGFPELTEPPRSRSGGASYEICPACGFQFGVSDDDALFSYEAWRQIWQEGGMRWASKARPAPRGWNPGKQLEMLCRKPVRPFKPSARRPARQRRRKPEQI